MKPKSSKPKKNYLYSLLNFVAHRRKEELPMHITVPKKGGINVLLLSSPFSPVLPTSPYVSLFL
jgi:hypothetical protein